MTDRAWDAVARYLAETKRTPCPFEYLGMACILIAGHTEAHLLRQRVSA